MLQIKSISSGYNKKQVLFDLFLDIADGEIVLLAGNNGSGKSTLLKTIYGLINVYGGGQIFFDGENMTGQPPSVYLKRGLLYIPQVNNVFPNMTVQENFVVAGVSFESRKVMKQRIEEVLTAFPLKPHFTKKASVLSGGERQQLAIAMAMMHRPSMLMLDEPFAGLSPRNIEIVADVLITANKVYGMTILFAEHHIKESLNFAKRVIGLKLGKLHADLQTCPEFDINNLKSIYI